MRRDEEAAARPVEGLTTRRVGDDLVVYDPRTHRTHALEPVAAAVLDAVDGRRDAGELAAAARREAGPELGTDVVSQVLAELAEAGLVTLPAGTDRRSVLRLAGAGAAGAVALPLVQSVVAPSVAAAQSGDPGGGDPGGGDPGGGDPGEPTPLQVTTLAGGTQGSADGTGAAAQFDGLNDLAVAPNGTIYVADTRNHRIRAITPTGTVTTFAGSTQGHLDVYRTNSRFSSPYSLALAADGSLYVADTNNHSIRVIRPNGLVNTLVGGQGYADGTGGAARFQNPYGLTVAPDGNIYVADTVNHRIRRVTPTGTVTTLAGGNNGYSDGTGGAAAFSYPTGIVAADDSTLYVTDLGNGRIRAVTPTGTVTTVAGTAGEGFADGTGAAARFNNPWGIVVGSDGTVYVADTRNHRIRAVTPSGTVTTFAGGSGGNNDGTTVDARFNQPAGLAFAPDGTMYVADRNNSRVRKIT